MSNVEKYAASTPIQLIAREIVDTLNGMREEDDAEHGIDIAEWNDFHLWGDKEYPKGPDYIPDLGYYAINLDLPPTLPKKRVLDAEAILSKMAQRQRTTGSAEVEATLTELSKAFATELEHIDQEIGDSNEYRHVYAPEIEFYQKRFARIGKLLEQGKELGMFEDGKALDGRSK